MVTYSFALLLSLLLPAAAIKPAGPLSLPGAFVVEFEADHEASSFYDGLSANSISASPRLDLNYKLFKGASFQLHNVAEEESIAKQIAKLSGVKQIWPIRIYSVPNDEIIWVGDQGTSAQSVLQKRQSNGTEDTFSTHVMTQVDQLRAEGVTGEGVRIAVIDTGIDYTHPALGGCFGEGCLVAYGTDLVGDNYNGENTPVPDPDPFDDCEGHGTHVAGIIAAQENSYGFTGAAPGVTLGAYRVFGCGGSAANDVLIAAYNQAYEDGSDIITASIGGASGWKEDPWAVAVSRIVEAGVPCTVSAGNSGSYGLFYASTAANGDKVTAIASVDNTAAPAILLRASYTVDNATSEPFGWAQGNPADWGNVSLPLWAVSFNTTNPADGCAPYPADTPDLSGYVVLVRRGSCTFVEKATYALQAGAEYVLYYNNVAGAPTVSAVVPGIKAIGAVTAQQGAEFVSLLANGSEVVLNIIDPAYATQYSETLENTFTGGFLSTYTSWGPTYEVDVYPDLAAPGGIILSTYPQALGSYAVLSGTSMACPLAAAVVALVGTVRGTFDPATIENALSVTSNPNLFHDGVSAYPYLAPVAQQGSGLIQAYDAAHGVTLLSVSSISFNDTDHFVETANFTISNTGSEDVTYEIGTVGAATGYTLEAGTIYPAAFPNELLAQYADIEFSEAKVTVPAGGSAVITVSPTPPEGLDASRLPVYSGYITLNGTNGENLSLPYLGVFGSLNNATVLDGAYLTASSDPDSAPVAANTTFVLPSPGSNSTSANTTYPAILISLALGSAVVRVDVVPQSSYSNATTIIGEKSLGNIYGYPFLWNPRLVFGNAWDGQLEDGSYAPAGTYTLLVRALRIFGERDDADSYDTTETVPFTIRYA